MPPPRPRAEPLRRARAPPPTAPSRGGRVQQRVLLSYTAEGTRCELKIRGTALRPDKVLGVDLRSAPPLSLEGGLQLPFGTFDVRYNDGELRIVRTQQGFWGVNRRLEGAGWGA